MRASAIFVCFVVVAIGIGVAGDQVYDVVEYGAAGNGRSDDTEAFSKAWAAACADSRGPTISVPAGKAFVLGEVSFVGPCKSSVSVKIGGDVVAPEWDVKRSDIQFWIIFREVEDLVISGEGKIDGKGSYWWECRADGRCGTAPYALGIMHCNNTRLTGVSFVNGPSMHVSVFGSAGVTLDNLKIEAPADSPNTDGIHIQESQQVDVRSCEIGTGDDCVSIGTGSSDIQISQVRCGPGHGISVGSLGKDGAEGRVERVNVSDCHIFNTTNGVRIKTWQGGSGSAREITFRDVLLTAVRSPIIIDQYYCPQGNCPTKSGAVQVSDVTYSGITGTTVDEVAINLNCSSNAPCVGITFNNVSIKSAVAGRQPSAYCSNVSGSSSDPVVPQVPCLL